MNVLLFLAHPDDEHGCSGLMHELSKEGHRIFPVVTTDSPDNAEIRRKEMRQSAEILGMEEPRFLGEVDGRFLATTSALGRLYTMLSDIPTADTTFAMWPIDVHPDHVQTAALAQKVFYQKGVNTPFIRYALNSAGRASTEIRPQSIAFFPTHYFPVSSETLEVMKKADGCHITQDPQNMWTGVLANLSGRGKEIGVQHAEGYVATTRLGDVPDWLAKHLTPSPFQLPAGIPFTVTREAIGI